MAHTTAGYLLYASLSHKYVFDHRDSDVRSVGRSELVVGCGWVMGGEQACGKSDERALALA